MNKYLLILLVAVVILAFVTACDCKKCDDTRVLNSTVEMYQLFRPQGLRSPIPAQESKYLKVDTAFSVATYYFIVSGNHTGARMRFAGESVWFYGDTIRRVFDIGNAPYRIDNGKKYGNVEVICETWQGPNDCFPNADTIQIKKNFYFDEGPFYCDTTKANLAYGWGTYTGTNEKGKSQILNFRTENFEKNAQAEPCRPVHVLEGLIPGYPNLLRGFWNGGIATNAWNILYGDFNRNRGYITCAYYEEEGREVTFFGWFERSNSNKLTINYTVYNQQYIGSIENKTFEGSLTQRR